MIGTANFWDDGIEHNYKDRYVRHDKKRKTRNFGCTWGNEMREVYRARRKPIETPHGTLRPIGDLR